MINADRFYVAFEGLGFSPERLPTRDDLAKKERPAVQGVRLAVAKQRFPSASAQVELAEVGASCRKQDLDAIVRPQQSAIRQRQRPNAEVAAILGELFPHRLGGNEMLGRELLSGQGEALRDLFGRKWVISVDSQDLDSSLVEGLCDRQARSCAIAGIV